MAEELSEEQKKGNALMIAALKKLVEVEPEATQLIYKIAKFAKAKPDQYQVLKNMLDKEVIKIINQEKKR